MYSTKPLRRLRLYTRMHTSMPCSYEPWAISAVAFSKSAAISQARLPSRRASSRTRSKYWMAAVTLISRWRMSQPSR